jgi:hypothetical protein
MADVGAPEKLWIVMLYTTRSLAFTWLIILALFAVSASGALDGPWFVVLVAVALATPMLVLRNAVLATDTSSNVQHHATEAVVVGRQRTRRAERARTRVGAMHDATRAPQQGPAASPQ